MRTLAISMLFLLLVTMTVRAQEEVITPLAFEERIDGAINSSNLQDIYSFTAEIEDYILIDYKSYAFEIPSITLTKPDGEIIVNYSPFGTPQPIILQVPDTGSYTITIADEGASDSASYVLTVYNLAPLTDEAITGTYTTGGPSLFFLVIGTDAPQTLNFEVTSGSINVGVSILEMDIDGTLAEQTRVASMALTHASISIPTENSRKPDSTDFFVVQLSSDRAMFQRSGDVMEFALSLTTDDE